jgi:phosphoribosylanthranilate isomerase
MTPEVKICGLTRREDAETAAAAGARYVGVVLARGGKRTVTPARAAEILGGLAAKKVGVFVDATEEELRGAAGIAGLDVLQLHGDESPALLLRLRAAGPWRLWKAIRPRGAAELLDALERFSGAADGLLLDGYSPTAHGGTGRRFPWEEIAEHRGRIPADLALVVAGGLHPRNVARAVALLRPEVVDVSSGVESAPGIKDGAAVHAFVRAARGAGAHPNP